MKILLEFMFLIIKGIVSEILTCDRLLAVAVFNGSKKCSYIDITLICILRTGLKKCTLILHFNLDSHNQIKKVFMYTLL